MIGIIVVTHGFIGVEMVRVARSIVKDPNPIMGNPMIGVALEHDEPMETMTERIKNAIQEVDRGQGVLLLVDLFGGTPANLCLSFLEENKVEVITGANLPMLIKLASLKELKSLGETALFIKTYGQKNIALAGEVLKK